MKTNIILLLAVSLMATFANAQDGSDSKMPEMQMPKPTKEHEILKKDLGTWEAEVQIWMSPTGEPMKSKGVETVKMMGEFWTISHLDYEFMGQKVQGHGLMGYDPKMKKYTGTWHDSLTPWPARMTGTYDAEKKTMTYMMRGKGMTGVDETSKIVISYPDDKTKTFELFSAIPGSDKMMKTVRMEYKKK